MRDSVKWDVAMVEEGGETERRVGGREISVGGGAIMGEWKRGCIWRWKVCGGVAVAWRIKKKRLSCGKYGDWTGGESAEE